MLHGGPSRIASGFDLFAEWLGRRDMKRLALAHAPGGQTSRNGAYVPDLLHSEDWVELTRALRLSAREAEVLRYMFMDERTSAIAVALQLSPGTVHTYRERLFRKVGVHSCAQMIALAFATYLRMRADLIAGSR
jgi:DNA-binding CsgD family transcriptional regulator